MLSKEQLGFAPERLPQVVVEIGKEIRVGLDVAQVAQAAATGRRSCSPARCDFGSASMRRTCASSTAGSCSFPWLGQIAAVRSSGMLLHRKNDSRDASSRSLIPDTTARRNPAGSRSTRNTNAGSPECAPAQPECRYRKSRFLRPDSIELHHAAESRHRSPAGGTPPQQASRQSVRAQASSFAGALGRHSEDALAAGRVARTGASKRPVIVSV